MNRSARAAVLGLGLSAVLAVGAGAAVGSTSGNSQTGWLPASARATGPAAPSAVADLRAGRIVVILTASNLKYLPLGGGSMRAVKPGDEVLFAGPLQTSDQAHRVGTANFQCTWQFGDHVMCQVSVDLTGRGQLTAAATTVGSASDVTFAVTGGTGNFQHARGQMHLHDLGQSNRLTVLLVH